MQFTKVLILLALVVVTVSTGVMFFMPENTSSFTFKSWLEGNYCEGFCWQHIEREMTYNELEAYLERHKIDYRVSGFNTHYQWSETQTLAPDGQNHTSVIYSEQGKLIRTIADMRACITTVLDAYGTPDEIRGENGHFSIIYFDSNLGEGWTFNFRDETIPYAEVVMRVFNDPDFSLNMAEITLENILDTLTEPCEDVFNS